MVERTYYTIDEEAARFAKSMMSYDDYATGTKTNEYRYYVDEAYDIVDKIEKERPSQLERAKHIADSYAKKLANNLNTESRIGGMCPSVMISGAGNFPTRKKEKQLAATNRNMQEFREIRGAIDRLKAILNGKDIVKSLDEDATERIREKIEKREQHQKDMKDINAYFRKNKTLKGCDVLSPKAIEQLEEEMAKIEYHTVPFPPYALQNNGAEIRRLKKRLERLEAIKEKDDPDERYDKYELTIRRNKEAMRIQLIFDGKPDSWIREILKSNGFKWSPKAKVWQRQINTNGEYATKRVLEQLQEATA